LEEVATGLVLGSKEFREEMLELIGQKQGNQHYGEELKESDEQKARRLLAEMLHKAGWKRSGVAAQTQGRCEESAHGGAAACGDDDDLPWMRSGWRWATGGRHSIATRLIVRQKR